MLRDLPPNGRNAVLLEPLWAVVGSATLYYLAFYMEDTGLTPWQIGLVLTTSLWLGFMVQLVAGTLTDRMGRRRATFVFDVLGWVVPMFLWAVAQNVWAFLLAYALNALGRVPAVASRLLATEDAAEEDRPRIFAGIRLFLVASGLVTPLVGLAMNRWGVQPTLRGLLVIGGFTMFAHSYLRNRLMTETAAGLAAMAAPRSGRVVAVAFRNLAIFLRRSRELWPLIGLVVLNSLAVQLNVFQVVYLASHEFGTGQIALLPAVAALAALAGMTMLRTRVPRERLERRVALAGVTSATSWLIFLATPPGMIAPLLFSTVLAAVGFLLMDAHLDVLIVSRLAERDRAEGLSALQTLTSLVAIPSGTVAALMYGKGPLMLFGLIALCHIGVAVLALVLRARAGQSAKNSLLRTG